MKRLLLTTLGVLALSMILPLLLTPPGSAGSDSAAPPSPDPAPSPAGQAVTDRDITLRLWDGAAVRELTAAEYLPLALAGEMPAAFAPEALKAQTVALRSYLLHAKSQSKSAHPQADLCTSAACCCAIGRESALRESWGERYDAYWSKLCTAVSDTDGQYLVWEEQPILAVFHASSSGRTASAASVNWTPQPYLQAVSTPETADTVPGLESVVEITARELRDAVSAQEPAADFSGPPETWLGAVTRDQDGRVESLSLGGALLSGLTARALFALRSTDFELQWTGEHFRFTVRGYGHGVGLSQFGADLMADAGSGYAEILAHYYPGAQLVTAVAYPAA